MRLKMKTLRLSIETKLSMVVHMDFLDGPVELSDEESPVRLKAWWKALDDTSRYPELETSLGIVFAHLRQRPVDAIVGFSQGAALAVMIAAILENTAARCRAMAKQRCPLKFPNLPQEQLKFVIAYSGFQGSPAFYGGLYKPKIRTSVLHVSAKLDHMITPEESARFIGCCRDVEVVEHQGGHWIPRDPKTAELITKFVRRVCENTR